MRTKKDKASLPTDSTPINHCRPAPARRCARSQVHGTSKSRSHRARWGNLWRWRRRWLPLACCFRGSARRRRVHRGWPHNRVSVCFPPPPPQPAPISASSPTGRLPHRRASATTPPASTTAWPRTATTSMNLNCPGGLRASKNSSSSTKRTSARGLSRSGSCASPRRPRPPWRAPPPGCSSARSVISSTTCASSRASSTSKSSTSACLSVRTRRGGPIPKRGRVERPCTNYCSLPSSSVICCVCRCSHGVRGCVPCLEGRAVGVHRFRAALRFLQALRDGGGHQEAGFCHRHDHPP